MMIDQVKEMFADQDNTLEFSDMNFDRGGKGGGKNKRGGMGVDKNKRGGLGVGKDKRGSDSKVKAKRAGGEKVLETAVFLDSAAYSRFAAYYKKIGEQQRH